MYGSHICLYIVIHVIQNLDVVGVTQIGKQIFWRFKYYTSRFILSTHDLDIRNQNQPIRLPFTFLMQSSLCLLLCAHVKACKTLCGVLLIHGDCSYTSTPATYVLRTGKHIYPCQVVHLHQTNLGFI